MTNLNDLFQTSDLALAATLYMYFPIVSIDKSNPSRVVFSFQRTAGLDELVQGFWCDSIMVGSRKYFESLKAIKARIYQS